MKKEILTLSADFYDWPKRWMGVEADKEYGERLLPYFEQYVMALNSSQLTERTKKKHLDNLWLAGGELIRIISNEEDYEIDPFELILHNFGLDGGPYCRHIQTEEESKSYDSSCRKFYKFMKQKIGEPAGSVVNPCNPPENPRTPLNHKPARLGAWPRRSTKKEIKWKNSKML